MGVNRARIRYLRLFENRAVHHHDSIGSNQQVHTRLAVSGAPLSHFQCLAARILLHVLGRRVIRLASGWTSGHVSGCARGRAVNETAPTTLSKSSGNVDGMTSIFSPSCSKISFRRGLPDASTTRWDCNWGRWSASITGNCTVTVTRLRHAITSSVLPGSTTLEVWVCGHASRFKWIIQPLQTEQIQVKAQFLSYSNYEPERIINEGYKPER